MCKRALEIREKVRTIYRRLSNEHLKEVNHRYNMSSPLTTTNSENAISQLEHEVNSVQPVTNAGKGI